MMKSPTSLIRFRNAVGVMLALSAIFAVVISAVTITQERALGQTTTPTVTISSDATDNIVPEGTAVVFTVTLSAAVETGAEDVVIPITVTDGTAMKGTDFTIPNDGATPPVDITSVTISAGSATATYTVTTIDTPNPDDSTDTAFDEPQESFTVSLGTLPSGYAAGETSSLTININDGDNEAPSPTTVTIDVNDSAGMPVDEDEQDPPQKIDGFIPKVGHVLTANTSAVVDGDQPLTADTTDDAAARDAPSFVYQWIRLNDGSTTADDVDAVIEGATSSTYTLTDEDVGDTFTVQVWSSDNFGNGNGNANTDAATTVQGENSNGFTLDRPAAGVHGTATVAYNEAKPFIIVGSLDPSGDDMRIEPGVVLTRDVSGMTLSMANDVTSATTLIGDDGMNITVDLDDDDADNDGQQDADPTLAATARTTVTMDNVTFTWTRSGDPIMECIPASDTAGGTQGEQRRATLADPTTALARDAAVDTNACTGSTYELINDDVADEITLVATYVTRNAADPDGTPGNEDDVSELTSDPISSEDIGRVYSPNNATGMPVISGIAQVGETLRVEKGSIADTDGSPAETDITYTWFYGDDDDYSDPLGTGTSYDLKPGDAGNTIKVRANFNDGLGDADMRVSGQTTAVTGSPGEISRIEPAIRSVTASSGDEVVLSVNVYGLQGVMDNRLGGMFIWSVNGTADSDLGNTREIDFTVPSSPGTYTVTASLGGGDCQPDLGDRTDAEAREDDCNASITVRVKRPSAPVEPDPEPVNPPGDIPEIIPDSDGNQYAVFTPVEGGTFDAGEGYSISVPSGAVPNGEYIGIRMSDGGAASNLGMTHQRYTLGGNMYGIHAVDASQAAISSYALEDPAQVCVPLPDELRSRISDLALVGINSDGSLTIHAASVRIDGSATQVCGNVSNLPTTVAVGSQGAPDAIPTATPEPEPVLPDTGATAPSSNSALWALILGIAIVSLGTLVALGRRRNRSVSR